MSATVIEFPRRPLDAERLALVGEALKVATPIAPRDEELDLLLRMGGRLLDNLCDATAIDCWLVRLDRWEGQSA